MEERPRVKIVDYTGSTKVERTKIDEKMKELGIALRLDSFLDQAVVKRVQGIVKSFMADKGYEFAEVTSTVEPLPAGPKLVKVVFDVKEGPKVKVRTINFNGNVEVSDGTLASQMKSTKAHNMLSWITGKGTYNENKFDEDAEKVIEYYRNKGYITRARRPARDQDHRRQRGQGNALGRAQHSDRRRAALPRRQLHVRGQQDHQDAKFLAALLQAEDRRLVFRQADSQRPGQGARDATAASATSSSRASRTSKPIAAAEGPIAGPADADRQRDDAHDGRRAVLRQPPDVRRQHHDARQRDSPRSAAARRRAVQYRSAQVQRQAPQPAWLLQAARRRPGRRRAEDAWREEPGRRHAEARRAEPQPADVRRRRVAVRRLLRPAVVPDLELPRPRRIADRLAAGRARARRTTRSRSPSRSCSIATSPAASTFTSARCATSISSRRTPPAATSPPASRWPASRACS